MHEVLIALDADIVARQRRALNVHIHRAGYARNLSTSQPVTAGANSAELAHHQLPSAVSYMYVELHLHTMLAGVKDSHLIMSWHEQPGLILTNG